jgi:DNA polymerase-3 subunit alpha
VEYYNECKKKKLKPVIGYRGDEIYVALNKENYDELLQAFSNDRVPDVLTILGAPFSKLANLVTDSYYPYAPNEDAWELAKEYIRGLGATANTMIGITPYSSEADNGLRDLLRDLAKHLGLKTCVVDSVHYDSYTEVSGETEYEPHKDHQILVCHRTKKNIDQSAEMPDEYKRFFLSKQYFPQDWSNLNEYDGCRWIVDTVEEYEILAEPQLPHFDNATKTLTNLAREGWREKEMSKHADWPVYRDRIKEEIGVINQSGFSAYFLVLEDVCKWIDAQGWMRGHGRGSAGGCLISYLTGITKVDPLHYDLLFERFFSEDRAKARQLPDIDIDVPKFKRQAIFTYLQETYGHDSVAQMVTFAALQGRSALTATLKFNDSCSFSEIKEITELLPHKDKVSDQMETVSEHSLIRWTLDYLPEKLANYARVEDGKIVGDYALEFEQAIRLEKLKVETSKHASAIIVYNGKIQDVCPMIKDKSSDEKITGLSMSDGEAVGLVKLDLLGLATLDKLMLINKLLKAKEEKNVKS